MNQVYKIQVIETTWIFYSIEKGTVIFKGISSSLNTSVWRRVLLSVWIDDGGDKLAIIAG
jgi:hypothetical protein